MMPRAAPEQLVLDACHLIDRVARANAIPGTISRLISVEVGSAQLLSVQRRPGTFHHAQRRAYESCDLLNLAALRPPLNISRTASPVWQFGPCSGRLQCRRKRVGAVAGQAAAIDPNYVFA
jgi:hypothetical protein